MTKENFEIALKFLFPSEGGYVNDKNDKGGPTNMGVTQSTYNAYRKQKGLPVKDVKNITKNEAVNIYYENYWKISGADNISDTNMAVALFDTAVLHGPYQAKKYYAESNGDINKFLDLRKKSYDKIIANDPSQKKYYEGWNNRVNNLKTNIRNGNFTSQTSNKNMQHQDFPSKDIIYNGNITSPTPSFQLRVEKNEYRKPYLDIPYANPVPNSETLYQTLPHIFTPSEIGAMSTEEFTKNESEIMKQLRNGQIQKPKTDFINYKNPDTGSNRIFTREDISKMSTDEYSKYENEILAQLNSIGIPFKKDLPDNSSHNSVSSTSSDGKWVTINGNHVFIEK